ncbi:MAG: BrnT family toxin [Planctomycetota bacterium]|nr:BrnT family toxin [Planctomycetota bacterium]
MRPAPTLTAGHPDRHAAPAIEEPLSFRLNELHAVRGEPREAELNLRKHRVSFPEVATVFQDPLAMGFDDPGHSARGSRFSTTGRSQAGRLRFVAHADRLARLPRNSQLGRPPQDHATGIPIP